jgi:ABC-type sugar transport system ATPase subunit
MTVVMITHNMNTVVRYAPRTVVMADGRKVADRSTRELFADEDALEQWQLKPPQPVALSNRLTADAEIDGALPALSVDEAVSGLGGDGVFDNTDARATTEEGESGVGEEEEPSAISGTDATSDGSDDQ